MIISIFRNSVFVIRIGYFLHGIKNKCSPTEIFNRAAFGHYRSTVINDKNRVVIRLASVGWSKIAADLMIALSCSIRRARFITSGTVTHIFSMKKIFIKNVRR